MQQGIAEPVEEVGYKHRPPLLEDVSVEGPLRIPIAHALDTLEQREAIEEDYNWWRYSKFAGPWLIVMLLLFVTLFVMTGFEQVGHVQKLRDGVARYFQLPDARWRYPGNIEGSRDPTEGNLKKNTRNLRIAEIWMTVPSIAVAFLTVYMKPRPLTRKIIHFCCAFVLLTGSCLAWSAFGIGEYETKMAVRCPEMAFVTNELCDNRTGTAMGALALDFLIAITSLTGVVAMCVYTFTGDFKLNRVGWRQQERDAETEGARLKTGDFKASNVHITRLALVAFVLLVCALLSIAQAVMIVVLHQDHNTVMLRSARGKSNRFFDPYSDQPWEETGWSARNTRLRYSLSGMGILTVILNVLPWRSRIFAYLFAFIYCGIFAMAIVQFVIDVAEVRRAKFVYKCPTRWMMGLPSDLPIWGSIQGRSVNCISGPFVACCIIDFFTLGAIAIYIINEYIVRYKSIHSQRKYPWFQIRKIEQELDSRRPVRCEITSEVMTAAEYYYRHRFLSEQEMLAKKMGPEIPIGLQTNLGVPPAPYDYSPAGYVPAVNVVA